MESNSISADIVYNVYPVYSVHKKSSIYDVKDFIKIIYHVLKLSIT